MITRLERLTILERCYWLGDYDAVVNNVRTEFFRRKPTGVCDADLDIVAYKARVSAVPMFPEPMMEYFIEFSSPSAPAESCCWF